MQIVSTITTLLQQHKYLFFLLHPSEMRNIPYVLPVNPGVRSGETLIVFYLLLLPPVQAGELPHGQQQPDQQHAEYKDCWIKNIWFAHDTSLLAARTASLK